MVTSGLHDPQVAAIPLFLLMGIVVAQCGFARDLHDAAASHLRHRRDGAALAAVGAHALCSAVTGYATVSAIAFASRASLDLKRHGSAPAWVGGTVGAASILGIVAPASLPLIAYGVLVGLPIHGLLAAGVIPGLMMATAFVVLAVVTARGEQSLGLGSASAAIASEPRVASYAIPVLAVLVVGGIASGALTGIEASGLGAFAAVAMGFAQQRLDRVKLWRGLKETALQTAAVLLLLLAGLLYAKMLAMAGVPRALASGLAASGLGQWGFLLLYVVALMAFAAPLDGVSVLAILAPLAAPVALSFGFEPIPFAVVSVLAIGCGMLAPPFGIAVFTVKAILGDGAAGLDVLFAAVRPYLFIMLALLIAVAAVPWLSLALIR